MDLKTESPAGLDGLSALTPEEVLDFSTPVNPLGPSKRAAEKTIRHLAEAFRRSDARSEELIQTLARFHGLSAEEILFGAGATEFIHALPRALSIRQTLMVTPVFGAYERSLEAAGLDPKPRIDYFEAREEDGFEVDANGLISALTRGYDALYLSNPGFPTGILTPGDDLRRVLAQTEKHKIWFILDETSIDFIEVQSLKEEVKTSNRLLILRSFSNFFALPGLRVGYLLGNREAVRELRGALPPRTVNALGLIAAAESLKDAAHIRRTNEWLPKERERLAQGLRSVPGFVPYPSAANYLLVQLLPFLGTDGSGLREELRRDGFRIDDCRSYPSLVPYFFSVAVRPRRENNLLIKALRKIAGELAQPRNETRPGR
jgi:threonine-phosphate decarboxylase